MSRRSTKPSAPLVPKRKQRVVSLQDRVGERVRRIVERYLRRQGGPHSGFAWGGHEELLYSAIETAVMEFAHREYRQGIDDGWRSVRAAMREKGRTK